MNKKKKNHNQFKIIELQVNHFTKMKNIIYFFEYY